MNGEHEGSATIAERLEALNRWALTLDDETDRHRVVTALEWMVQVHEHQADRPDGPYLNHTLMVAERVRRWTADPPPEVVAAALLHDAVEDGEGTLLAAAGHAGPDTRAGRLQAVLAALGPDVAGRLDLLTNEDFAAQARAEMPGLDEEALRREKNRRYAEHVAHAIRADPWVAVIKLADWSTNGLALDNVRDPDHRSRLTDKYRPIARHFLALLDAVDDVHPLHEAAPALAERIRAAWPDA